MEVGQGVVFFFFFFFFPLSFRYSSAFVLSGDVLDDGTCRKSLSACVCVSAKHMKIFSAGGV
jgi:hypothetical protein